MSVCTPVQAVFLKIAPYFFFNFFGEESSQPIEHPNKIIISIFLIMKALTRTLETS